MLGKINWWDNEAKMGTVQDVEGKEWKIFDDMVDDDSQKAKMKVGLVVNFEANPSIDNSAMSIDVATPEDQKQFQDDFNALLRAVESKLPNTGLEGWCPSLSESKLSEADEEQVKPLDVKKIAGEAPYELKEFVDLIIDYNGSKDQASIEETMEDDDALHEMADSNVDVYTKTLWEWYAEDFNRGDYIDAAVDDGLADPKGGIVKLLMVGQYAYNTEKLAEAVSWLKEYFDGLISEAASDIPKGNRYPKAKRKLSVDDIKQLDDLFGKLNLASRDTPEWNDLTAKTNKLLGYQANEMTESEGSPVDSYLETALWADGSELGTDHSVSDFSASAVELANKDWDSFKQKAGELLSGLDLTQVAHDFWLTRSGHGAGFWDGDYDKELGEKLTKIAEGYPSLNVYLSDDGKLELE